MVTKNLKISEADSLILWNVLETALRTIEDVREYNKTAELLVKTIHMSCDFADTNDGMTVEDYFQEWKIES